MIFSVIGLVLDVVGVCILFVNGPPSRHDYGGFYLRPEDDDKNERRKKFNDRINRWGFIALGLLVLGFLFQIAGIIQGYATGPNNDGDTNSNESKSTETVSDASSVSVPHFINKVAERV